MFEFLFGEDYSSPKYEAARNLYGPNFRHMVDLDNCGYDMERYKELLERRAADASHANIPPAFVTP